MTNNYYHKFVEFSYTGAKVIKDHEPLKAPRIAQIFGYKAFVAQEIKEREAGIIFIENAFGQFVPLKSLPDFPKIKLLCWDYVTSSRQLIRPKIQRSLIFK